MNADLVRASGLQFDVEQSETIEPLPPAIQRPRAAAAANNRHARAVRRIACEWLLDASGISLQSSVNECDVRLEHRAIAKLIGKIFERGFGFRDDEQAGRVAIQTVHDAGADTGAAAGKLFKVISECVCERARVNSRGGMDHEARWFVHADERLVFV